MHRRIRMSEQEKNQQMTHEITQIGMSVAMLIAGGVGVLFLSRFLPIPGTKYLFMGAYIGLVMSAVVYLFSTSYIILKINVVLAGILSVITIYMGIAILITGIGTQLICSIFLHKTYRGIFVGMTYAGLTVLTSIVISKFFIGDALFVAVDGRWIAVTVLLAMLLGSIGGWAGKYIGMRVRYAIKRR